MITKVLGLSFALLFIGCGAADNSARKSNNTPGNRGAEGTIYTQLTFDTIQRSQIARTKNEDQSTYDKIALALKNGKLPDSFFLIPSVDPKPSELAKSQATQVTQITGSSAQNDCGAQSEPEWKVKNRIDDCSKSISIGSARYWSAKLNGVSGEGDWALVSFSEKNQLKVWRDLSTGLLWSDIVGEADFAGAIGKNPKDLEAKLNSICNQDIQVSKSARGNMPDSNVKWRLPSRAEFLQADINGARFVLDQTANPVWTATFEGLEASDFKAWSIEQSTGILKLTNIMTTLKVRCIGVVTE